MNWKYNLSSLDLAVSPKRVILPHNKFNETKLRWKKLSNNVRALIDLEKKPLKIWKLEKNLNGGLNFPTTMYNFVNQALGLHISVPLPLQKKPLLMEPILQQHNTKFYYSCERVVMGVGYIRSNHLRGYINYFG